MKLNFFAKKTPSQPAGSQPPPAPSPALPPASVSTISRGLVSVQDVIAPPSIDVDFSSLKIGSTYVRTLFISGYPRYVSANWLSPLITFEQSLSISMFIYPVEGKAILDDLRRKVAEMEAEISTDIQRGKVVDPATQAKLEDAQSLQEQLVKGAERFFQFGLYITIPAESQAQLDQITKEVVSTLGSLLIIAKTATLQMEEAFKTTTPVGLDHLLVTRNMDTTSLATTFPFTSSELSSSEGIMYGLNEHNGSLIIFDRFARENANMVLFAKSGAGKSTFRLDKVLVDDGSGPKIQQIGPLIENLITQHGLRAISPGIEGVVHPCLKVWTFDHHLAGKWNQVTVAARKKFSPRNKLYTVTTKSGRQITVTADHNLVVLRQGKIRAIRSEAVKIGEAIPLSRKLDGPDNQVRAIFPPALVSKWPRVLPRQIKLEKEFLTLLGLITSEGHTTPKNLEIYNTDPAVLKEIEISAKAIGFSTRPRYNYPHRSIIGFSISPAFKFAELVHALGGSGSSGEKRIPPIIFSLANTQIAHYLRAYYEGDGSVENHAITAVSKSKDLVSDLAYLFLRFGIVARISVRPKLATNTLLKTRRNYYCVSVSGKENLIRFASNIGFLTDTKNQKLARLISRLTGSNTNVDTIPTLQPIFKFLYKQLYSSSGIGTPQDLLNLKNGKFNPSPHHLKGVIASCELRIMELRSLRNQIQLLRSLLPLTQIISRGAKNRKLNHLLWEKLGQSWRTMKKFLHPPETKNVFLAAQTITGQTISLPQVNLALSQSFKHLGMSLREFDRSLWSQISTRKSGSTGYANLFTAAKFITREYRSTQLKIRHSQEKLSQLKLISDSDLFWDPIVKIDRIKHREKYVYDLQVENGVFLAGEGGMFVHNSYLVKLEALRYLMLGSEVIVIDPEAEYQNLCTAVGGQFVTFGFNSPAKINPFDLSAVFEEGENELPLKILSLHSLFKIIMGQLTSSEEAILDRALIASYRAKGITMDPATQKNAPPLMEDLYKALVGMEETEAKSLADRIEKFVKGSFRGVFDEKSTVELENPMIVFSLRDMEEALRPIAMFIVLDFVWTRIKRNLKKRILIIDEAWYLMKYGDSATFIHGIAKRARKYYLGLTTITQDVEDFLSTDHGKAIITNSSIQILMKQSPAAIEKVAQTFFLSQGEKQLLLSADVGEGIFFAGTNHVAFRSIASPDEHKLITSNPEEVLAYRKATLSQSPPPPPPPPPVAPPSSPSLSAGGTLYPAPQPPTQPAPPPPTTPRFVVDVNQ